jgi:lipopolysaccharide biosynthesis glycosyltransferase
MLNKIQDEDVGEVVFAVNDRYLPLLSVAIISLLKKCTKKLIIRIIYSTLSNKNKIYLKKLCDSYDSIIFFHEIKASDFYGLPEMGHLKIETYYRMAIPEIIYSSRVLYLDCDIIFIADPSPLFKLDISDFPLAAVKDPIFQPIDHLCMKNDSEYFNAGIMIMNLEYWRKNKISEKTLNYLKCNPEKITFADQCALNAVVDGNYISLDSIYNFQAGHLEMPYTKSSQVIIHFSGSMKPTNYLCQHPFKEVFLNELSGTPYNLQVNFYNFVRRCIEFFGVYPFVNKFRSLF